MFTHTHKHLYTHVQADMHTHIHTDIRSTISVHTNAQYIHTDVCTLEELALSPWQKHSLSLETNTNGFSTCALQLSSLSRQQRCCQKGRELPCLCTAHRETLSPDTTANIKFKKNIHSNNKQTKNVH